jgi:hypothetical protein
MSQVDWYYARDNKQSGPVSGADLKRIALAGDVAPDDLVWREGMAEWTLARNVRGLFDNEPAPVAVGDNAVESAAAPVRLSERWGRAGEGISPETAAIPPGAAPSRRHPIDVLLGALRGHYGPAFVATTARLFRTVGLYGLLAASALSAVVTVLITVRTHSLGVLLTGLPILAWLVALHYAAGRTCDALERLNRTTCGTLNWAELPNCVAALCLAGGFAGLLTAIAAAMQLSLYWGVIGGIVSLVTGTYLAIVALNHEAIDVSSASDANVGGEAIGVFTFLLKTLMQGVPVVFGAGVVYGAVVLAQACLEAASAWGEEGWSGMGAAAIAVSGGTTVIASAAWPLLAYVLVLLYFLLLDLCRAVLRRRDREVDPDAGAER